VSTDQKGKFFRPIFCCDFATLAYIFGINNKKSKACQAPYRLAGIGYIGLNLYGKRAATYRMKFARTQDSLTLKSGLFSQQGQFMDWKLVSDDILKGMLVS
jgi:hypothetical protein